MRAAASSMTAGPTLDGDGFLTRNGGRAGVAALAAILALGLGLRLSEAWSGRPPVYDAAAYARIAANLDRGDGFSLGAGATQPASNYSPGVPLLAGGVYAISGGVHERLARLVLALIGTLAIPFAYLIGRRLSGVAAGLVAGAATAVYPALVEYQGMLMGEPLATTLLAASVLAVLWAADATDHERRGAWIWLGPGMLLGTLALVRPEYLGIAALIGLTVLVGGFPDDWRRSLLRAAVLVVGVAVVVAPWTVRNAVALERFVPVSTGAGQVLFAGSYLPSGGDPEAVGREVLERHPGLARQLGSAFLAEAASDDEVIEVVLRRLRLEQILAALAAQRHPGMEADRALAQMGRERLWEALSRHPLEYIGFLARKAWRVWGHGPRRVMHEPGWAVFQWLLLGLALVGLAVLVRRRRWEVLLLGVLLLAITAVGLLLVATPRRGLVAVPLVAALAGVGLAACLDSLPRWQR